MHKRKSAFKEYPICLGFVNPRRQAQCPARTFEEYADYVLDEVGVEIVFFRCDRLHMNPNDSICSWSYLTLFILLDVSYVCCCPFLLPSSFVLCWFLFMLLLFPFVFLLVA